MAKKRNTIENYPEVLYCQGMTGDEEASWSGFIFYLTETDESMQEEMLEWWVMLAEKGGALAFYSSLVQVRWRLWREAPAAYIVRQELL